MTRSVVMMMMMMMINDDAKEGNDYDDDERPVDTPRCGKEFCFLQSLSCEHCVASKPG